MSRVNINITARDYMAFDEAEFVSDVELYADRELIIKAFLDKHADSVRINRRKNGARPQLYTFFEGKYRFGGIVGMLEGELEADDTEYFITLKIFSRLDGDKPYFLTQMLKYSGDFSISPKDVPESNDEFFDLLLWYRFKRQLQEAYLKGFFKTYRRFEENDSNVRASIDIARHIRENLGQNNGKIAYSYKKNTHDNDLNKLIIKAYNYVCSRFSHLRADDEVGEILRHLKNTVGFSELNTSELISKNLRPISHPYYIEYEELRKTSIMILRDEEISIFGDDENKTQGIFYYLPDLWEIYLEALLIEALEEDNSEIEVTAQMRVKVFSQGADKFMQDTYPDFVFLSSGNPFMMLDAKFKPGWESALFKKPKDMQDYDKCIRDMNSLNAHATGVIFPVSGGVLSEAQFVHGISIYNTYDRFYTFAVSIPESDLFDDFSEWEERLKKNLKDNFEEQSCENSNSIISCVKRELERTI